MSNAHDAIDYLAAATKDGAAGLFLDFDGTLAPVVADPSVSRMPQELVPVLRDIAATLSYTAVVSGRPMDFLLAHVQVPRLRLLGLYGLQESSVQGVRVVPDATAATPRVRRAVSRLRTALAGADGVFVEDKGLTVAVHWRNAPDRDAAEREVSLLMAALAVEAELEPVLGKLVAELRPPGDWHKGSAVTRLMRRQKLSAAVYIGDDLGDLPAFAAVQEVGGLALAVSGGDETPQELLAQADATLDGPEGVAQWLIALRGALA